MKNQNRDIVMTFRVTQYEYNRIKGLARLYAEGDLSTWIRWGAFNAERKLIKKEPKRHRPGSKKRDH